MMKLLERIPFSSRIMRVFVAVLALVFLGWLWYLVRPALTFPAVPGVTEAQLVRAERVTIVRDEFGVPHIFGKTDADAAFGFAYAHAEDDWRTIFLALTAARGELSRALLSETAVGNDFFVRSFRVQAAAEQQYARLSPEMKAVLEAYAAGLNFYAARHPDEADGRFLPITGVDVARGFAHKLPLFQRVNAGIKAILDAEELNVGDPVQAGFGDYYEKQEDEAAVVFPRMIGSNAHAVGRRRSADGIVRLNVNSHQPYTGAVAWYEAHVVSEEGWNTIGGTFPGAPVIFVGHNENLGWAHTVNAPDMWDIYKLEMHPERELTYRLGDEWRELETYRSRIMVDVGLFEIPLPEFVLEQTFYRSVHGPVIKGKAGYYAIRHTAAGREVGAVEQWYRMNKARNFDEWRDAMRRQNVPMMHTIYADARNIFYVYNALLPNRDERYDYRTVLPGNELAALWDPEVLPFDRLPSVLNPPADFVQNCNSDPFFTTTGNGNPRRDNYSPADGIETRMTNRAIRSRELFGGDESITAEEFQRYKWDQYYSKDAPIYTDVIYPVLAGCEARNGFEQRGLEMLHRWDGSTHMTDTTAALAIRTFQPTITAVLERSLYRPDPCDGFREAVTYLLKNFGRIDVPLGEAQRIRRGETDLPMGGGPDILNAVHTKPAPDGKLVGWAGDTYVQIVEFTPDGPRSFSLHQFGNVSRPESEHYDDQAFLMSRRLLRPSLFHEADLRARTEREYHPGAE